MAGLDLSGIRAVVDGWLVDTIKIERDNGNVDDVLNEVTGLLEAPPRPLLYDGAGAIQPIQQGELDDPDVARLYEAEGARYRALLPLAPTNAVKLRGGDLYTATAIVAQTSDPNLVGRTFAAVDRPTVSSFAVLRIVYLRPLA